MTTETDPTTRRPPARSRRVRTAAAGAALAVAALAVGAALPVGSASASTARSTTVAVTKTSRGSLGTVLVTGSGATLYRYTPDRPNTPTCTGACASAWPPLLLPKGVTTVHGGAGLTGLGSVRLADGRRQVTYQRTPLYTYAGDSGTSANGQGVEGIWFVVHPTGAAPGATSTHTTATTAAPSKSYGSGY